MKKDKFVQKRSFLDLMKTMKDIDAMLFESEGEMTDEIAALMQQQQEDVSGMAAFLCVRAKFDIQQTIDSCKDYAEQWATNRKRAEQQQDALYRTIAQLMLNNGIEKISDFGEFSSAVPSYKAVFEVTNEPLFLEAHPQFGKKVINIKDGDVAAYYAGEEGVVERCTKTVVDAAALKEHLQEAFLYHSNKTKLERQDEFMAFTNVGIIEACCQSFNASEDTLPYVTTTIAYSVTVRRNATKKNNNIEV